MGRCSTERNTTLRGTTTCVANHRNTHQRTQVTELIATSNSVLPSIAQTEQESEGRKSIMKYRQNMHPRCKALPLTWHSGEITHRLSLSFHSSRLSHVPACEMSRVPLQRDNASFLFEMVARARAQPFCISSVISGTRSLACHAVLRIAGLLFCLGILLLHQPWSSRTVRPPWALLRSLLNGTAVCMCTIATRGLLVRGGQRSLTALSYAAQPCDPVL